MKEFKHTNDQDNYWVECDQCARILEPYQQIKGLCSTCMPDNDNQLLDDCDAGLDDDEE